MRNTKGFTLIELLVVVSVIVILAYLGYVIFSHLVQSSRDTVRKADIDAISKAYESHFSNSQYQPLQASWFTSNKIPTPPDGGNYSGLITNPSSTGFQVCTNLESGQSSCKQSLQVTYAGPNPSPSPSSSSSSFPNNPITRRALLIIYDPILSNSQKLHQARGWADPLSATQQTITAINQASNGAVNYQLVDTIDRNEWPRKIDGFRYTEATFNACIDSDGTPCHRPDDMDYAQMWSDMNICNRVSSGQIDEIFVYGAPYFGFDEFAFKIPGDRMPYNTPSNYWFYEGRKKNIPDCNSRTVFVMGWNYAVGVAGPNLFSPGQAIHSYSHRIESALALTLGRGYWDGCSGHNSVASDFDEFTCINKDINIFTPVNVAGCGNTHFPPNGLSDYDYANVSSVQTACDSWNNYPFTTKTINPKSCSAWGCNGDPQVNFAQWWLNHIPRNAGKNSHGNLNNWWKYIVDFDNAIIEVTSL